MGKKSDYIKYLEKQLNKQTREIVDLEAERDFLADQVDKLESVLDDKQKLIDSWSGVMAVETE